MDREQALEAVLQETGPGTSPLSGTWRRSGSISTTRFARINKLDIMGLHR